MPFDGAPVQEPPSSPPAPEPAAPAAPAFPAEPPEAPEPPEPALPAVAPEPALPPVSLPPPPSPPPPSGPGAGLVSVEHALAKHTAPATATKAKCLTAMDTPPRVDFDMSPPLRRSIRGLCHRFVRLPMRQF